MTDDKKYAAFKSLRAERDELLVMLYKLTHIAWDDEYTDNIDHDRAMSEASALVDTLGGISEARQARIRIS